MNILILRLSSIGDILLASPFIRQTRKRFPGARIDFTVKSAYHDLVRYNPHLDRIYAIDGSRGIEELKELKSILRSNRYSYIFDLHNNLRTNYLLQGYPDARISHIEKSRLKRALLVYTKLNLYKTIIPIPLRYLKTGESAGIKDDGEGLELFTEENPAGRRAEILKKRPVPVPYLVVAPGAGFSTKQYPLDYMRETLRKLVPERVPGVILVGDKSERNPFGALEIHKNIVNLAGELNLLETASLIDGAKGVLANDSGIMHMSTAMHTPVLAIFGSTVEELGFFPFRGESNVVQNEGLWCRPCSHVGRDSCPLGHFRCMRELTPDLVVNRLNEFLEL